MKILGIEWNKALRCVRVRRIPLLVAPFFLLCFVIVFVILPGVFSPAQAVNVNSDVEIIAEIQEDGSLIITDTRTFTLDEGTEYYLSWGNLGDSEVINANVVLDGEQLEDVGEWDIDRSRQEKAGQFGMRDVGDQVELAFGYGEYGEHTVVMTYQITNVVKNLEDGAQAVYWEFIPQNTTDVQQMSVSLTNDLGFKYTQENSRIWAFGFEGTSEITRSAMTMTSSEPMGGNDYAVMLAVWLDAPFQASSNMTETVETLTERAFDGSDFKESWYDRFNFIAQFQQGDWRTRFGIVAGGFVIVSFLYRMLVSRHVYKFLRGQSVAVKDPRQSHQLRSTVDKDFYWRDIPYQGSAFDVCSIVGSVAPGAVDATLLWWLMHDHVRLVPVLVVGNRENVAGVHMALNRPPQFRAQAEAELWQMLAAAAGPDGYLAPEQFAKWAGKHRRVMKKWMKRTRATSEELMEQQGLIQPRTRRFLFTKVKTLNPTPTGQDFVNRCSGFKNFLREYSLIAQRDAINVKLWDHYMIWAAMLGIAEQAREQLTKIYPGYEAESAVGAGVGTIGSVGGGASSSQDSAFSGGGGSSSGGGGGGAGGGGGGGGGR